MNRKKCIQVARSAMAGRRAHPQRERGYTFHHGLRTARISLQLHDQISKPLEVSEPLLFVAALFFYPIIQMVGSYPPITAPALVVVGSMMIRNVTKIDWGNYAESMPAFLIIIGIPMTYSIADGLALGFIAYPIIKLSAGQGRDVKWLMYVMAVVLVAYFLLLRMEI